MTGPVFSRIDLPLTTSGNFYTLFTGPVISLNTEKAFGRIEWSFLWAVIDHVGAGQGFMKMVKTLYNCFSAGVLLASSSFALGRGTCQGCPLTPLHIISGTLGTSTTCVNTSHKISFYVVDILLFVSNITASVPGCLNL